MKRRYITLIAGAGLISAACLVGCGSGPDASPQTETISETDTAGYEGTEDAGTSQETEEDVTEAAETPTEAAQPETDANGVHLGDYTGFTYYRDYTAPTDEDVEETIQEILDSNTSREYLEEGTVKEGDTIVVTFAGSVDGVEDSNLSGEEEEFTVGGGTFLDEFESSMVGREAGKEFTFSIDFPEDYEEKAVAGKTADFEAVVEKIAGEEATVELTDEWVKENSAFSTVEEYRENIMDSLVQQEEEYADSSVIYGLLSDLYNVSYAGITEEELNVAIEAEKTKYVDAAEDMEMDFDEYVKEYMSVGGTDGEDPGDDYMERFDEYLKNQAETGLEQDKILASFCEKEGVDTSHEAYQAYLEKEAAMYGYGSADEFLEELESVGYDDEIHDIFIEIQAGHRLMEISREEIPGEAETELTDGETEETESAEMTETAEDAEP